jgi:replicative DNA helicase
MPLREFPQSIAAEAAELLCVEAFYYYENRAIYEALLRISNRCDGRSIDCVLLRDELVMMGKMEEVGIKHIIKIMDSVPSTANAMYYAKIVREKYKLRKLIVAGKDKPVDQIAGEGAGCSCHIAQPAQPGVCRQEQFYAEAYRPV